jgi:hypothetical protein
MEKSPNHPRRSHPAHHPAALFCALVLSGAFAAHSLSAQQVAPSVAPKSAETTQVQAAGDSVSVQDTVKSRFSVMDIGTPPKSSGYTFQLLPDSTDQTVVLVGAGGKEPWDLKYELWNDKGVIISHSSIVPGSMAFPGELLTPGKYYVRIVPGQKQETPWLPFQFVLTVKG